MYIHLLNTRIFINKNVTLEDGIVTIGRGDKIYSTDLIH